MGIFEYVIFGNTVRQLLILLIFIILSFAVGKVVYWISTSFVRLFTKKTKTQLDDILIDLLEKPVIFLIILAGIYLGVNQLTIGASAVNAFDNILKVLTLISVSWILINFIDALIINYLHPVAKKAGSAMDGALVPVISKAAKIVMWAIVIIMIIKNFGYDVSALITGVGIGGLAFALAAQDLLSNLFGGVAILSDKPFRIGDRVRIGASDGWVREIGLRTTRIETLDGTQLIVPNAEVAKTTIENVSREKARKVTLNLGLEYGTSNKKIIEAQQIIKDILVKRRHLGEDKLVGLSDFGAYSLNVQVIYWIKPEHVNDFFTIRHDINMEIKEKLEKAGIAMAFPTTTVLMEKQKVSAWRP